MTLNLLTLLGGGWASIKTGQECPLVVNVMGDGALTC